MQRPSIDALPLADVFDEIIRGFGRAVLLLGERGRPDGPVVTAVWAMLMRSASTFRAIARLAAAGGLPALRARREAGAGDAGPGRARRAEARRVRPVPPMWARCRMWLQRLGRQASSAAVRQRWMWTGEPCVSGSGAALYSLVQTDADMQALMRASASGRRLVRKLLWMSCDRPLHECLKEPPRRRRVKPDGRAEPSVPGLPADGLPLDGVPVDGLGPAAPDGWWPDAAEAPAPESAGRGDAAGAPARRSAGSSG